MNRMWPRCVLCTAAITLHLNITRHLAFSDCGDAQRERKAESLSRGDREIPSPSDHKVSLAPESHILPSPKV